MTETQKSYNHNRNWVGGGIINISNIENMKSKCFPLVNQIKKFLKDNSNANH